MRATKKTIYIIILSMIFSLLLLTGCFSRQDQNKPVVKTSFLMDTLVKITAYGPGASDAIDKAFDEILEIQNKMTAKGETSEVISINNAAGKGKIKVSEETINVIERGLYYSHLSAGRFDITIGPLIELWGIGTEAAKVPSEAQLKAATQLVDYKKVLLNKEENSVMLERENMGIDLGAIAKGYAADAVKEVLLNEGVDSAAIDLGGNIMLIGSKPDGSPWRVGLQSPFDTRGNIFATLEVVDKTLVTSGTYERYFEYQGKRYHHILDPQTGYPVENGLSSVTIIANSSMDADGLSTAAFALGLKDGMELIKKTPGISAVFVTDERKVYTSSGLDQWNFTIVDDSFERVDQ